MNAWQNHVARWESCQLCTLCTKRSHVVLFRGSLPCACLFIGEAPGEAEDTFGLPFVGVAGQELDRWIKCAFSGLGNGKPVTWGMTNLIACIPKNDDGEKVHEPEVESVEACTPRLLELVAMAQPKVVVCVGAVSDAWLDPKYRGGIQMKHADGSLITRIKVDHPSRVLRTPIAHRNIMAQRAIVQIKTAVEGALHF